MDARNGIGGTLKGVDMRAEIDRLRKERNAVILAHYYQKPEIQDLADFVGDSLDLSRKAQATDADVIAFCGVRFMAETAKILSPDKIVVLPDMDAGCSLEDSCPPEQFAAFRAQHPDHDRADLHQLLGGGEGAERRHRHQLVGREDPAPDSAGPEDHLRPRPQPRRLSRAQDRARPAAVAGRVHRPRGVQRNRAAEAEGAASRRAGRRASRMPAGDPRPRRLRRLDPRHPGICRRLARRHADRRDRAAHHPPDGKGAARTSASSARRARTATATATSARTWRSTRWRSSTSRCAISSRGSRSRKGCGCGEEEPRRDAGDGERRRWGRATSARRR